MFKRFIGDIKRIPGHLQTGNALVKSYKTSTNRQETILHRKSGRSTLEQGFRDIDKM